MFTSDGVNPPSKLVGARQSVQVSLEQLSNIGDLSRDAMLRGKVEKKELLSSLQCPPRGTRLGKDCIRRLIRDFTPGFAPAYGPDATMELSGPSILFSHLLVC